MNVRNHIYSLFLYQTYSFYLFILFPLFIYSLFSDHCQWFQLIGCLCLYAVLDFVHYGPTFCSFSEHWWGPKAAPLASHLNSSELQTVKTSAFVEVLTLQVHLISSTWLLVSPLIPEVRVYLTSHRTSEYCENLLFQTVIDHNWKRQRQNM